MNLQTDFMTMFAICILCLTLQYNIYIIHMGVHTVSELHCTLARVSSVFWVRTLNTPKWDIF